MVTKTVIVGGDAAGMSAAAQIRRVAPSAEVVVFEKTNYASYASCGMPYYIAGDIASHEDLLALTAQEIADRGIDVRYGHAVEEIRPGARIIAGRTRSGQPFNETYDHTVLATGERQFALRGGLNWRVSLPCVPSKTGLPFERLSTSTDRAGRSLLEQVLLG